jgi:hypothetical protein
MTCNAIRGDGDMCDWVNFMRVYPGWFFMGRVDGGRLFNEYRSIRHSITPRQEKLMNLAVKLGSYPQVISHDG